MNKNIKKAVIIASASLIMAANAMSVLAATPVPSKSNNGGTASQTTTEAPSGSSSSEQKATSKPASTQKATSKPKATEKATSKPKTSSSSATTKPTSNPAANPSESPEASPTVSPSENTTTSTDPLIFSEEADKSVVTTTDESAPTDNARYTTKGGSFGWFILSIIINAIISFIIGNRFYKMSRRDTHVLAEIRALKKDIDAKMQYNIGGFSEYETVINNANKSYAKDEDGIKPEQDAKAEELATEIYKKWENQVMAAKTREASHQAAETRRSSSKSRSRTAQRKNSSGLSGKVKDFINDVFPFDKD